MKLCRWQLTSLWKLLRRRKAGRASIIAFGCDTKSLKQLAEDMKKLPLLEDLSNVVFVCGEEEIKAQRCILAACSPVFMATFTHEMAEKKSGC